MERHSTCSTDQTIERLDVVDEKTHDSTLFKAGSWLHGRLVLLELAYFYRHFALIDETGGYFVSRSKKSANPVAMAELREWHGRATPLGGEQIYDEIGVSSQTYIDVEGEAEFKPWGVRTREHSWLRRSRQLSTIPSLLCRVLGPIARQQHFRRGFSQ